MKTIKTNAPAPAPWVQRKLDDFTGKTEIVDAAGRPAARAYLNGNREQGEATARLIVASVNAFEAAARRMSVNAVDLAEKMQNGMIADLLQGVKGRPGT